MEKNPEEKLAGFKNWTSCQRVWFLIMAYLQAAFVTLASLNFLVAKKDSSKIGLV